MIRHVHDGNSPPERAPWTVSEHRDLCISSPQGLAAGRLDCRMIARMLARIGRSVMTVFLDALLFGAVYSLIGIIWAVAIVAIALPIVLLVALSRRFLFHSEPPRGRAIGHAR